MLALRLLGWPAAFGILSAASRDNAFSDGDLETEWPRCTDLGKDGKTESYECIPPLKSYSDYCFPTWLWGLVRAGEPLGAGSFGSVRKAYHVEGSADTCEAVAAKVVDLKKLQDIPEMKAEDIEREMRIQMSLVHDGVLKMYGGGETEDGKEYIMFLELVGGGDLRDRINDGDTKLSPETKQRYAYELAAAFSYIHSQGVVHLDLKPENILLTDATHGDHIKVADFGLSEQVAKKEEKPGMFNIGSDLLRRKEEKCHNITGARGTEAIRPPEMFTSSSFDGFKADVWSLGVTFYEIFTGRELWSAATKGNPCFIKRKNNPDMKIQDVMKQCRKSAYASSNKYLSEKMDIIISQMLAVDPEKRPDMQQVLHDLGKPGPAALLQLDEPPPYERGQLKRPKATHNLGSAMQKLLKV